MNTNKMLDKINDAIEEAIKPILGKGAAMTAAELEVLTKAVCTIEKIKQLEDAENYSEYSRNSYNSYNGGNSNNSYGGYNSPNSYDNYSDGDVSGFYRNDNSYRRGRSATTGRFVSRDDGYSTRRYYDAGNSNNYSGHSIKDRMIDALEKMYDTAQTEHERQTVNDWIRRLETANWFLY